MKTLEEGRRTRRGGRGERELRELKAGETTTEEKHKERTKKKRYRSVRVWSAGGGQNGSEGESNANTAKHL